MSGGNQEGGGSREEQTMQAFGIPAWASLPIGIVLYVAGAMLSYWVGKTAWGYV